MGFSYTTPPVTSHHINWVGRNTTRHPNSPMQIWKSNENEAHVKAALTIVGILTLVKRANWLRNQAKFFVVCFVSSFGGWPYTKPDKIQKVDMYVHTTNQEKHCDYVIHAYSINVQG